MGFKIVSDNHGNMRRISDGPDRTNIVITINRKKISDNHSSIKDPDSQSTDIEKKELDKKNEKEDVKKESENNKSPHVCIKGIGSCQEKEDGNMWLYVGTYKGRINFCPYCGYKAKEQILIK